MWCQEKLGAITASPTLLTTIPAPVLDIVTCGRKNPLWLGLARRVKRLRSATALTMDELAALAGCSNALISKIEAGQSRTSIAIAESIAVAFGVSPTFLAFGHEGVIPFRQKQPVPDVLPVDPVPCPSKTMCGAAAAHCGVGARLTRAREVRGCTLRGLAQRAGLSAQAVLYIENAKVVPKVDTCELLAVALDVAPGWLAYGEGQGPEIQGGA